MERAVEPNELALELAQALRLPETLHRGLQTKAMLARGRGRPEEALALLRHSLQYALEHDLPARVVAASYGNLSDECLQYDRYGEALEVLEPALTLLRRMGDRIGELYVHAETSYVLTLTGRWDEALDEYAELGSARLGQVVSALTGVGEIFLHRGEVTEARELLASFADVMGSSIDLQDSACLAAARAALAKTEGNHDEALRAGLEALEARSAFGLGFQAVKQGLVWTIESALEIDDLEQADELVRIVEEQPPGLRPPYLEAQGQRFRARMLGDEERFKASAGGFREYGIPFWLAVTQLEHAEWLVASGRGREADSLLTEAQDTFERLRAVPWIERVAAVGARPAGATAPA
jgi:tetratricopeptide (TPR) repeat protein